jgi:hypothetical protein
MERREVANAIEQLEREGTPVSNLNIKRLLGYGSMRDIVGHRKALATLPELRVDASAAEDPVPIAKTLDPVPDTDPAPVVRTPADPIAMAEALLADAECAMDQARDVMDTAALALLLSSGVVHQGTRYGAYLPSDPAKDLLTQSAAHATDSYRHAVGEWERCKDSLASAIRHYRRGKQERYVATHQPELVETLAHWRERLRTAPSDRAHAEAKKNLQQATFDYERAVATAPWEG